MYAYESRHWRPPTARLRMVQIIVIMKRLDDNGHTEQIVPMTIYHHMVSLRCVTWAFGATNGVKVHTTYGMECQPTWQLKLSVN